MLYGHPSQFFLLLGGEDQRAAACEFAKRMVDAYEKLQAADSLFTKSLWKTRPMRLVAVHSILDPPEVSQLCADSAYSRKA